MHGRAAKLHTGNAERTISFIGNISQRESLVKYPGFFASLEWLTNIYIY